MATGTQRGKEKDSSATKYMSCEELTSIDSRVPYGSKIPIVETRRTTLTLNLKNPSKKKTIDDTLYVPNL